MIKLLTFELVTKEGQILGNDKEWHKIFIRVIIHISLIVGNNMIIS